MTRLRVPAGVIVGGRSVGGRFTSAAQLVQLAQRASVDDALAIGDVLERARLPRDADRVAAIVARKLTPRARRVEERPEPRERFRPEPRDYEEPPDIDVEWEMGMEYLAAGGRGSNVDINIRFARDDGRGMDHNEARAVFDAFRLAVSSRYDVALPEGYHFAAINWRRPSMHAEWRGGRHTGESTLVDLLGPMVQYADQPDRWRVNKGSESDI